MKKKYLNTILSTLSCLMMLLIGSMDQVNAQNVSFAKRGVSRTINGDFQMIGNTNLTLVSYSDNTNNSNNDMKVVDIDGDNSTTNSSSATLNFSTENGADINQTTILFAGLYWSGRTDEDVTDARKKQIKIKGPTGGYVNYTASEIRYPGTENMYVGFVDVTSLVQSKRNGSYTVADIAVSTGDGGSIGYYGGWGMIVVYDNPKMNLRDISVFDGYAFIDGSEKTNFTLDVTGINTLKSGAVNMKIGLMTGEGDVDIPGDYFEIKNQSNDWISLSHLDNSTSNFFNSSVYPRGTRIPDLKNNTGVDVSMFTIPNVNNSVIKNEQTSATFRYGSVQDTYVIYCLTTSSDAYLPGIKMTKTCTPGCYSTIGSQLTYQFDVKNDGNAPLNTVVVTDPKTSTPVYSSGDTNSNNILDINETWIFKANYTVTANDLNSLSIVNTAEVTAKDPQSISVKSTTSNTVYKTIIANAGIDQTQCETATATLSGNTPAVGTGTWTLVSGTGSITSPSSATSEITGLGYGANVFRWTISNGTCTASSDEVTITRYKNPSTANAGIDQTQCETATATLAGNTPVLGTGTWTLVSGAGSITSPFSATSEITGLGYGANVFRWTISNGTCAATSDEVTITRYKNPSTANAGIDQTQCETATATLTGNTPAVGTGTWTLVSGAGSITSPSSATSGITGLGYGANVFRWTISNGTCAATSDEVTITRYKNPSTANAGIDQTQCETATATLAGNTPVVGTGTWTLVSGTGSITSPSSATSGITGLGYGANVFRWTITNGTCAATSDEVTITRYKNPSTANAGIDQTQCETATATLTGNTPVVGTGTWTLVSGTGSITSPSSATSGITGLGYGANVFRWTITNGTCAATSDEVTITRYKNPSTANAGIDQTQCETATATLTGNTPAVGTGTWTLVSGAGSITSPSSATSGITGLGYGANVFRWTISNGTCAATSDEVTITRYKNPSTANAGIDQTQCGNGNFTVSANIATVGIGTWTIESGSGSIADINSASTEILNIPIGTSTVLKWKIVNGNCSTEDTIILHNNNCSIDITKDGVYVDSNNDGKTNVGDIVFYNFVIKNTGNVTLTNVTVTDNNAMINGGPIASLAVGASDSTTFSGTHVITQEDINKGYVYNLALATAKDPNDKPVTDTSSDPTPCATCPKNPECADCTTTELNQNPSIEVVKTAITTSFAKVGDIINYVITVKNNGNVTLNQVMIKDPLTGLNTTIEVLATGETREFPQSYMVTQEDLNKGSVLNIASASGKDPKGNTVSDEDSEIVSEKETPIDAVNDTAGPIVGVNQITTNVINVFTNDTLNGTAVKPNDVILTTDNSNPYLHLNEDGSVDVLANAPEGTLTLNYQLCEKLNTSNCDTATVTITIVKPVMTVTTEPICINDVPYLKYSATAVNFTPTNGVTLTWMDNTNKIVSTMTNLPLSGQVLWPGATVDANGIGTDWPGWLLVDNKWIQGADGFENIRPTASVTFALNPEVTVILNYPPSDPFCISRPTFKIDAVDDTAGPINGFYGESNILNVFTNDTLNTVAVNPKEVNLKEITNSSNGLLTLNSNGFVDVKPNTPSGTYQITYQICEKADASNCDTAVVTVTVINTPPAAPPIPIFAEDDLVKNVNGATGATKILNILTNDVLDKKTPTLNTVTLSLVTPDPTGSLTLNLDGTIDVKAGTPAGTYTFVYQICEIGKPTNCDTATVTVTVMCNDFTKVYGKITNVDTNTPLPNVPITLKPLNGTPGPVLFRVTKADGSYSFDNMVAGEYVLQVQDANLNSAYGLFNTTPSFLIIKVEKCNYSKSDFGYGKTDLPVLGDFVWYDLNNNGKQDEWYDANNDNLVTQNIPDANGVIDYSKWEWIDFNGDGSYKGIQNIGELNAAGFGNGTTNVPNIYITGPNGFSRTVTMGILGYWRTRTAAGAFGEYRIEIKEEPLLEAASQAIAATGLVKVLPTKGGKAITTKSYKTSSYIDCGTTTNNVLFATLTDQKRVNLDIDFGISCKTFTGVDAIDDTYSLVQCSQTGLIGNVITNNDLLNGIKVTPTDINFKIITGSNPFITFDSTGNLSILSGISTGKYVFTYQICNTKYPNDCDTATVSIEITPIPAIAINSSACNADTSVIDLNTLLPTNIPTGGTWIDSNNSSALKGNLFSAYELAVGDYQLEYKITNGDCPNRVVINMNVNNDCKVLGCGTVIIHNAFTPNGDGLNEIFKIENIDDTICYPENTLEVYNRWGVLVFETKNYNNSTNNFDGVSRGRTTIMQGSGLPTGTYFYILNYTSFDSNGNAVENKKDGYLYLSK